MPTLDVPRWAPYWWASPPAMPTSLPKIVARERSTATVTVRRYKVLERLRRDASEVTTDKDEGSTKARIPQNQKTQRGQLQYMDATKCTALSFFCNAEQVHVLHIGHSKSHYCTLSPGHAYHLGDALWNPGPTHTCADSPSQNIQVIDHWSTKQSGHGVTDTSSNRMLWGAPSFRRHTSTSANSRGLQLWRQVCSLAVSVTFQAAAVLKIVWWNCFLCYISVSQVVLTWNIVDIAQTSTWTESAFYCFCMYKNIYA